MVGAEIVPVVPAQIVDGRLVLDRSRVREVVRALGDGDVEVVIRRRRIPHSRGQHRLWRAIVAIVAEATGEDHDRTHYSLLGKCFGYEWMRVRGKDGPVLALLPRVGHSGPLTRLQMRLALDWAFRWVQDPEHGLGLIIPETEEAFDGGDDAAAGVPADVSRGSAGA